MNCPKCGNSNIGNSKFCTSCGNLLHEQENNINMQNGIEENTSIPFVRSEVNQNSQIELPKKNDFHQPINNVNSVNDIAVKRKIPKVKLIILGISLIVFIGTAFGIYSILKGDNNVRAVTAYFDENKLILIKENDLYGYIDSDGKVVVTPQYKDATSFVDKYAVVKLPIDEFGKEYYAIIDNNGKVVLNTTASYSGSVEYITEEKVWLIQGKIYDKNLSLLTSEDTSVDYLGNGYFTFSNNNSVGIMSSKGKITYSVPTNGKYVYLSASISKREYEEIENDYCRINIDNDQYAIINYKTGKIIYDFTDKYISNKGNNLFEIQDRTLYKTVEYVYIENNKVAYKTTDTDMKYEYIGNHIIEIRDNNYKYTYFDIKNNKTLENKPSSSEFKLDNTWELATGFDIHVCENGKYGIKSEEKIIVSCDWDNISYIEDPLYTYAESKGKQLIFTKKDGKINLYNIKDSKIIKTFNTSYLSGDYGDSIFLYYRDDASAKKIVYNTINNKESEFDGDAIISVDSNYFTVKDDTKIYYYNTDFKLIYTINI